MEHPAEGSGGTTGAFPAVAKRPASCENYEVPGGHTASSLVSAISNRPGSWACSVSLGQVRKRAEAWDTSLLSAKAPDAGESWKGDLF